MTTTLRAIRIGLGSFVCLSLVGQTLAQSPETSVKQPAPWGKPAGADPEGQEAPKQSVLSEPPKIELAPADAAPKGDAGLKVLVEDILKKRDEEAKKKEEEKKKEELAKGYEVGSKPGMTARWDPKGTFLLESEHKDFRLHLGHELQFDSVWWGQPPQLLAPPAAGGIGPLDDGMYFRRIRVKADGAMWDVVEFNTVMNIEGINQLFFDWMWIGAKEVPFLGTVRFGQHKVWQGLDSLIRNEDVPLMERSMLFDAFWQEFAVGVFQSRALFDERLTISSSFHRLPLFLGNPTGAVFADGEYAASARVTILPIYEHAGRYLVHLGGSYHWRAANLDRSVGPAIPGILPDDNNHSIVRFRARPEMRDAVGVGGLVAFPQGNSSRIVDTGNIIAHDVHTVGLEALAILGPVQLTYEATMANVVGATFPATPVGTARGGLFYWGTYVQASWFLTGENRGYNKRFGYYEKVIPNEQFFITRDEKGGINHGRGAWELLYRYTYVDLNSDTVRGGLAHGHTVGLSWHLNPNMRWMFNYTLANRIADAPANSGILHGVGTRMHWEF